MITVTVKDQNALVQIDGSSDDDDDDDAGRGGSCELYDRFAAAFYCRSFSVCKGLQQPSLGEGRWLTPR